MDKGSSRATNLGLPVDDPATFSSLSEGEKHRVLTWIGTEIHPAKRENRIWSSYSLKEEFERSPVGFYVTNGQFKGAMEAAGHLPTKGTVTWTNWQFKITYERR